MYHQFLTLRIRDSYFFDGTLSCCYGTGRHSIPMYNLSIYILVKHCLKGFYTVRVLAGYLVLTVVVRLMYTGSFHAQSFDVAVQSGGSHTQDRCVINNNDEGLLQTVEWIVPSWGCATEHGRCQIKIKCHMFQGVRSSVPSLWFCKILNCLICYVGRRITLDAVILF